MNDRLQIILDACLRVYCADFTLKSRKRKHLYPRAAFYYLAKDNKTTLSRIGKICGGRDHATVLHGLNKVGDKDGEYMLVSEFKNILQEFEKEVYSID